jgi:hypothetical protein
MNSNCIHNLWILLHHWISLFLSFPETYYLLNFELQNIFYEFLKYVIFFENLNLGVDWNWLWPDWLSWLSWICWCRDDVKEVNIKSCSDGKIFYTKVVEITRSINPINYFKFGKRGGQDPSYTLWNLNLAIRFSPYLLNEIRWDLQQLKDLDKRNNFRVEGASIRDHLRGQFGSGWFEINFVLKT